MAWKRIYTAERGTFGGIELIIESFNQRSLPFVQRTQVKVRKSLKRRCDRRWLGWVDGKVEQQGGQCITRVLVRQHVKCALTIEGQLEYGFVVNSEGRGLTVYN